MADAVKLLPGEIEVFRAGDYPQGAWPLEKVKAAAERYDPVNEHKAFIGVDPGYKHGGKNEGRAYGLFDAVREVGGSLIATLSGRVPKPVREAFANGELLGWSAEMWPEYQFNDGTVGPYFKGIKLLGEMPPQIKGLKAALEFSDADHGPVQAFDMSPTPYAASKLADVLKADETRRELSDIQWAFSRETEKVMCASDLSASEKRAELNRLATELATLTEGEVEKYEEEAVAETKKTDSPAQPDKPAVTGDPAQFAALESQFAEMKKANEALAAKAAAQDKLIEDLGRGSLRSKIATFSEQAKKDGKLIAGDVEAGVDAFMEAIEPVHFEITKGDKTETVGALAWFQEHVGRRLAAVPDGVNSKGAKGAGGKGALKRIEGATPESVEFADAVQAYADEHNLSYVKAYPIVAAERAQSA